jgi:tRNA threonylcarbamoyladenosine biosynthesis protein TsaB
MIDNTLVLGIETSGLLCSVAFYQGGRTLLQYSLEIPNAHASLVGDLVDEGLKRINREADEIGLLAVATGPGSFTGLRIGMSYALGFAFVRKIPVIGINNFDVLMAQAPETAQQIVAVIDARRGKVYRAEYSRPDLTGSNMELIGLEEFYREISGEKLVVAHEQLRSVIASERVGQLQFGRYGAEYLCRLGLSKFRAQGADNPDEIEPLYLQAFAGVS